MSNESTYTSIAGIVNDIWEGALLTLSEQSIMPKLVRNFSGTGLARRSWASYTGGTWIANLPEADDLSAQTCTSGSAGVFAPVIMGANYFLTDARLATDAFNVRADAAQDLGRIAAVAVDTALVTLFSSLYAGTVGSAGGTLTWANVQRASAYLKAAYAPGPYFCVLRPEQWYYLTSAASDVPTLLQSQSLMDVLGSDYYAASWGGINFVIDSNITTGTAAVAGMFSRDAMAIDWRKAFGIEPQRDASRSGGGWELNATMWCATGLYRKTFGVEMIGTSA
jgi:hypothetical protein